MTTGTMSNNSLVTNDLMVMDGKSSSTIIHTSGAELLRNKIAVIYYTTAKSCVMMRYDLSSHLLALGPPPATFQ